MHHIVLDLEFNWPFGNDLSESNGVKLRDEIIEIGAVKLDDSMNGVGTFNSFVHPEAYPVVNEKVYKLTGISTEMLWRSNSFPQTMRNFMCWCGEDYDYITWSNRDTQVLKENMLYHSMDAEHLPKCFDIQKMFDDQVSKLGRAVALGKAIAALEINMRGRHLHDALCDAIGTAEVFKRLDLENGMESYVVPLQ